MSAADHVSKHIAVYVHAPTGCCSLRCRNDKLEEVMSGTVCTVVVRDVMCDFVAMDSAIGV